MRCNLDLRGFKELFKKNFGGHMSFNWDPNLDFSPFGYKIKVGTLGRGIHDLCFLRFTSGVTPANLLMASMVAS